MAKRCGVFQLVGIALSLISVAAVSASKSNIAYELYGRGSEHILVLHDWLGDRTNYDPIRPYLDVERYTYAFVDLRGYGESRDIEGRHTADEAAADAVSVADALGWEQFHIVGHSMTGMVVQRIALNEPERIKSVIATSPVAASGMAIDEETWTFFQSVVTDTTAASNAIAGLTGNKLSPAWVDFKVRRAMQNSTPRARMDYLHMFVKHDFSAEASKAGLQTPFLVILGKNDFPAFQPEAVNATFGKWYSNVEIVSIDNAGHYAMQETPALFASTVEAFLDGQSEQ